MASSAPQQTALLSAIMAHGPTGKSPPAIAPSCPMSAHALPTVLLSLAVGVALVLGYFVQARRATIRRHAALARARHWRVEHRRAALPAGTVLEIAAPGGTWTMRTEPAHGTTWRQADLAHPDGVVVLGPAQAEARYATDIDAMGTVSPPAAAALLVELLGPAADAAQVLGPLRIVGQPPGRTFTMLAIGAGSGRLDLDAIDARLAAWHSRHPDPALHPVLCFDAGGLSVRLSQPVTDLDLAARFIDLALDLRGAIGPA
ncbi:hypothetical protein [Zavarzinia sp. CC-PAN008]|uniref:hypothetical protein n=1 Tax=Zavarzinia sp. CC-PAN008 TaxID=3243332 RepID=UPI003F7444A7